MIRTLRNKDLQKSWELGKSFQHKTLSANEMHFVLDALNAATVPTDVAVFWPVLRMDGEWPTTVWRCHQRSLDRDVRLVRRPRG